MQPIHSMMQPMAPPGAAGLFLPQQPETGAFDFMSYLLGLQASPVEGLLSEGSPLPAEDAPGQSREGKDPLLAVLAAAPQAAAQVTSALPTEPAKPAAATAAPIGNDTPKGLPGPTVETALRSLSGEKPSLSRVAGATAMNPPPPFVLAEDGGMALDGPSAAPDLSGVKKYAAAAKATGPMKAETEALPPLERAPEARPESEVLKEPVRDVLRPELRVAQEEALPRQVRSEKARADHAHPGSVAPSFDVEGVVLGHGATESVPVLRASDVTERIQTLVYRGGGEMTVALDPPELGKVEIRVSTRGNRVEVEMKSESQGAKQALESHFADLRSALESQDLRLSRLEVQVNRESPTGFSLHGNHPDGAHQGRAHGDPGGHQERSWSGGAPARRAEPEPVPSIQSIHRPAFVAGSGRVDLRV